MKYPHFFPVSRKCRIPETRRKMEVAYQSRCIKENTPILEEMIRLRQKHADLLGYRNHAAYVQEVSLAQTLFFYLFPSVALKLTVENGERTREGCPVPGGLGREAATDLAEREDGDARTKKGGSKYEAYIMSSRNLAKHKYGGMVLDRNFP